MRNQTIKNVLNVICLTCLLVDSGGGLGLRNISFLIIFSFAFWGMYVNFRINKIFLLLYFALLLSLLPALFISLGNSLGFGIVISWVLSFLFLPILYFYIRASELNTKAFAISGTIFAVLIIMLFFGRLYNIGFANNINDYITDHSDGFFGDKNFLSGDVLPNVYFQGTLGLIICGSLALGSKKIISFLLILIALIVAPSRFGFVVLVGWAAFLFFKKKPWKILFLPVIFVAIYFILVNLPFGKELFSIFSGEGDGMEIRRGHFESVFQEFSNNRLAIFVGQGPGSEFYTKGFGTVTDNIEISQLEYARKYGIISFVIFNLLYFIPMVSKSKGAFVLKATLIIYYIVAFSNPVLFSIFAMLFLAYTYSNVFDKEVNISDGNKKLEQ